MIKELLAIMLTGPLVVCATVPANAQLWGGKSSESFEIIYVPIGGVELNVFSTFLDHPYEVVVHDTAFGDFMVCQLFDAQGEVVATQYANSQSNVTRIHFETKVSVKDAKCAYTQVVEPSPSSR